MTTPTRKRTTSPAFQFYPKEFLSSAKVIAMTATERGVYITLLSIQWLDGSLPDDLAALARLVGINAKAFAKMWPHNLARCFTARHGGRLVNERLERERKKQAEFRQKQATNAAKGWDSRKDATASPPHQSGNALRSPISDLQSPISDLQSADTQSAPVVNDPHQGLPLDRWFAELHGAYPSKAVSRGPLTEQAFMRAVLGHGTPEVTFTVMLANLASQKRGAQFLAGKVPRLDRWLTEGLWEQRHDTPADDQAPDPKHWATCTHTPKCASLKQCIDLEREARVNA